MFNKEIARKFYIATLSSVAFFLPLSVWLLSVSTILLFVIWLADNGLSHIKELLKYVNDIILGVMGVNYSTIILYDEKRMKLKVHTTSIKARED